MKRKEKRFRNQYNYDPKIDTGFSEYKEQSMTVPDESYSIKDLLKKHRSGIPVNVERDGQYDDDPDHDDIDRTELLNMDLAEKAEILEQQKELQQAVKDRIEENKKAKAAKNELNEKRTEPEKETEISEKPSIQEEKKQEEN